jgi:hypothetical protein
MLDKTTGFNNYTLVSIHNNVWFWSETLVGTSYDKINGIDQQNWSSIT